MEATNMGISSNHKGIDIANVWLIDKIVDGIDVLSNWWDLMGLIYDSVTFVGQRIPWFGIIIIVCNPQIWYKP